jgi:hypothetical protein
MAASESCHVAKRSTSELSIMLTGTGAMIAKHQTTRALGMVGVAMFLGACSRSAPDLAGTWKSERTTLTISQQVTAYKIVAENPKGLLSGNYTSEFRDGRLTLNGPIAPLCGDMKYAEQTGTLNFCGEEFTRVQK